MKIAICVLIGVYLLGAVIMFFLYGELEKRNGGAPLEPVNSNRDQISYDLAIIVCSLLWPLAFFAGKRRNDDADDSESP